jgi:beta-lactamase class A
MRYVYHLIENGQITPEYMIHGQGVGQLIRGMIQWSDNHATNLLIDYFGMELINQYLHEQGYTDTVLQRRMMDMDARHQGRDNYTSTRDTMRFLKGLYYNQSRFPYSEMIEIMLGQEINTKIPLLLPSHTAVANKTGELHDVENDIGIVFGEGFSFAIVLLSSGVNNTGNMRHQIGQLALLAYDHGHSLP